VILDRATRMPLAPRRAVLLGLAGVLLLAGPSCALLARGRGGEKAEVSARARFNAAYSLILAGQYAAAAERLDALKDDPDPNHRYRDDATFWLGYCYQELGRAQEAGEMYREVIAKFPESPYAGAAREKLLQVEGK